MITGRELIEKMYSENYDEYEDTRLYSTGDDYLDELLERAFCEGYEYAQKEFALTGGLQPSNVKLGISNVKPGSLQSSLQSYSSRNNNNRPRGPITTQLAQTSSNNRPRGPITTGQTKGSASTTPTTTTLSGVTGVNYTYK